MSSFTNEEKERTQLCKLTVDIVMILISKLRTKYKLPLLYVYLVCDIVPERLFAPHNLFPDSLKML